MMGHQLALIRREIWEHRAIYVTPIAIAVIVSLISLAGMVTVSAFDKELNIALFSASNIAGDAERQAALTVFFLGTSWVFLFALAILTTFYSLDSLYAERKDKRKQIDKVRGELDRANGKLANEKFVNNAPPAVVEQERTRVRDFERTISQLSEQLDKLDQLA